MRDEIIYVLSFVWLQQPGLLGPHCEEMRWGVLQVGGDNLAAKVVTAALLWDIPASRRNFLRQRFTHGIQVVFTRSA
jgi:hypothetical protein